MKPWIGTGKLVTSRQKTFGDKGKMVELVIECQWEEVAQGEVTANVPMALFGKAMESVKGLRDGMEVEFCGYLVERNGFSSWRLEWCKAKVTQVESQSEKLNFKSAGDAGKDSVPF